MILFLANQIGGTNGNVAANLDILISLLLSGKKIGTIAFKQAGILWERQQAKAWESKLGMRLHKNGDKILVLDVHPSSPAEVLGFWRGDQILEWNQTDPEKLLSDAFEGNVENIEIQWIKNGKKQKVTTDKDLNERFYTNHKLNFHS